MEGRVHPNNMKVAHMGGDNEQAEECRAAAEKQVGCCSSLFCHGKILPESREHYLQTPLCYTTSNVLPSPNLPTPRELETRSTSGSCTREATGLAKLKNKAKINNARCCGAVSPSMHVAFCKSKRTSIASPTNITVPHLRILGAIQHSVGCVHACFGWSISHWSVTISAAQMRCPTSQVSLLYCMVLWVIQTFTKFQIHRGSLTRVPQITDKTSTKYYELELSSRRHNTPSDVVCLHDGLRSARLSSLVPRASSVHSIGRTIACSFLRPAIIGQRCWVSPVLQTLQ